METWDRQVKLVFIILVAILLYKSDLFLLIPPLFL